MSEMMAKECQNWGWVRLRKMKKGSGPTISDPSQGKPEIFGPGCVILGGLGEKVDHGLAKGPFVAKELFKVFGCGWRLVGLEDGSCWKNNGQPCDGSMWKTSHMMLIMFTVLQENAEYPEEPFNLCDAFRNPQPQEILPHPVLGDYGYPTKRLSQSLYFY
ncbi:hypothetical protein Pint_22612 [Pistacia integerrima]|uniref:Uncharacterized protein n=1 Tax=Pistacia integerrima TaxID=434235 RepID=A0ACC0YJE0_9ROSI|nr:hypothetical protein Pint_22612 [Pistacia integerrima]